MGPGPNDRGNSRYHIIKACEDSLRRLQTDHIDLYQLHRPALDIPQDETLRALDDLVRAGKVRYIGSSPVSASVGVGEVFVSGGYVLGLLPWSPLAGGILAGRYNDGLETVPAGSRLERTGRDSPFAQRVTRRAVAVARAMAGIARERGLTAGQMALLWCKDQPGITAPIIGPRTMEQLQEALAVLDLELGDERARLDELNPPGNAVSDFHNSNSWMKARIRDEVPA